MIDKDLQDPANYPEPRPPHIKFAMTHGSWVFLTDVDAFKVKRPVDVGFFNFTTLESRRVNSEAEVRLNRRLAPDVYLGVRPVWRDEKGYSFNREGEVGDYAVWMRRLPDSASAAFLVEHDLLKREALDAVAQLLAGFYERAHGKADLGKTDAIRFNVEENFQVPGFPAELRAWQSEYVATKAPRFEKRVALGRIREGHGDLRLEHVYFLPAGPVAIDCIEFNERFRHVDQAGDVAFFAMELEDRGRHDLAAWFLARFAQHANDYDLYPVIDFHQSYRAAVRAKIAAILAADPAAPEDVRKAKHEESRRLFDLALTFSRPPADKPGIVAVGGLIGSGKSTLADEIGWHRRAPVVRSDETRKHLAGIKPTEPGPAGIYTPEFTTQTFDEMFRRAEVVLDSGRGVILDASFRTRELRLRARDLARDRRLPFLFVETACDDETIRERLYRRDLNVSVSDARIDLLERFRRGYQPVIEMGDEHVKVDTARPLQESIRQVLERL